MEYRPLEASNYTDYRPPLKVNDRHPSDCGMSNSPDQLRRAAWNISGSGGASRPLAITIWPELLGQSIDGAPELSPRGKYSAMLTCNLTSK